MTPSLCATADFRPDDLASLRAFLDTAYAGAFDDDDWDHCCGGVHILLHFGGEIAAHAAVVHRPLEIAGVTHACGYVEAVATASALRHRGFGSRVMRHAVELIRRDYAMGALSTGEPGFYARLGWMSWRGPSFVRAGGSLVRTPGDDDGIMVLPVEGGACLDLASPIICPMRMGDVW